MDSVTHVAFGAAIGIAVMGRRSAIWKAGLWGGACATLPDLDVFVDHGDAIRNMTLHRAESHALFYLSLASAPLAWLIARIRGAGAGFGRWWLATWLALASHPLLDWLTIYGTQLALPFSDFPFALGSIFVIDPLFTLLLVAGLVAALAAAKRRPGSGRHWNLVGLGLGSAYLAWGVAAQAHVTAIAHDSLPAPAAPGAQARHLLVVPSPFNTLLWRVLAMENDSYLEGYYSLLDRDRRIEFRRYPSGAALQEEARDNWYVNRIAWFSHGFFRIRREEGAWLVSDLRMGQEPSYTFTFSIPQPRDDCDPGASAAAAAAPAATGCPSAKAAGGGSPARSATLPAPVRQRIEWRASLEWLWRRMLGEPLPFPGT